MRWNVENEKSWVFWFCLQFLCLQSVSAYKLPFLVAKWIVIWRQDAMLVERRSRATILCTSALCAEVRILQFEVPYIERWIWQLKDVGLFLFSHAVSVCLVIFVVNLTTVKWSTVVWWLIWLCLIWAGCFNCRFLIFRWWCTMSYYFLPLTLVFQKQNHYQNSAELFFKRQNSSR